MRPAFVDQTVLYDPANREEKGNCTEASVASILGLKLEDVPDFRANGIDQFWTSFYRFFHDRGYQALHMPGEWCPDVLYLAAGKSPRDVLHMVLMKGGELVHDPHPSKAGIEKPEHVWLVVPIDPGQPQMLYASVAVCSRQLLND
ncbi:hypothetical protein I6F11_04105 [Ensifer sp. NBAIM29]|nr:hypothetical protein [Ensifer sp. NBAIM29]